MPWRSLKVGVPHVDLSMFDSEYHDTIRIAPSTAQLARVGLMMELKTSPCLLQATDRGAAAQDFAEGTGEVDPLDAFMAQNEKQMEEDAEEVDPLDAFMAGIAPTVRQDMAATTVNETSNGPTVKIEDGQDVKPTTQVSCQHSQSFHFLYLWCVVRQSGTVRD